MIGLKVRFFFQQRLVFCGVFVFKLCTVFRVFDLVFYFFFFRLLDFILWIVYFGMYVQGNVKFVFSVRRIVVYEYYNSQIFDYDIVLLQFSIVWFEILKQFIQLICIFFVGQKVRSGEKCWVIGWGRRYEVGVCLSERLCFFFLDDVNLC